LILLRWRSGEGSLHWSFLETITGFLKLVELCEGLIVVPCLASLVEVYGVRSTSWKMGNMICGYSICHLHRIGIYYYLDLLLLWFGIYLHLVTTNKILTNL
jgi:hypothetical protein